MAASARPVYALVMKIAYSAGLTLGEWLRATVQAWLAPSHGSLVFAPIRVDRRRIAITPRFCLAVAMGEAP